MLFRTVLNLNLRRPAEDLWIETGGYVLCRPGTIGNYYHWVFIHTIHHKVQTAL